MDGNQMLKSIKRTIQKTRWNYFREYHRLPEISISEIVTDYQTEEPKVTDYLCLPPYAGFGSQDDYSPLMHIVMQAAPEIVLEFGTAHGATVANICAVSDAQVYTLNALPDQIEGKAITFTLTEDEIGCVYREQGFEDRVVQIYENTRQLNILDYLDPNTVDLAIIDACHDSEFVVNDFMKIIPVLSKEAIVLFHDVHPSLKSHLAGPYVGCMYLRKMGFNVKHIEDTWWGIWIAGDPDTDTRLKFRLFNHLDTLAGRLIWGGGLDDVRAVRWLASLFATH